MRDKKPLNEVSENANTPEAQPPEGGINPSAPSTGTEDWGGNADEKRARVIQLNPEASSPNARGAGDVRYTSYPQNEAAQNPAAWEEARPRGNRSLSCADTLGNDCGWSITGSDEVEVLGYLRAHAREAHGKSAFTATEMESARHAIRKLAA